MSARRLFVLPTGTCRLSESRVRRGGSADRELSIPMPVFAVETDNGWVLFDTGCDPRVGEDPVGVWGRLASAFQIDMTEEDHLVSRLASLGLGPTDIRHVVVSHLHMDHAGGMQFFPESTIHVQTTEMRHGMYPDHISAAGFVRTDFDRSELTYELAEGDFEVVPGVWAIFTPGHSPGHQSLLVQLPSGPFLITGDAAYEHRQLERCIPPPVACDDAQAVYSLKRLRGMQLRDDVHVIVSHDADAWPSLERGPDGWYS